MSARLRLLRWAFALFAGLVAVAVVVAFNLARHAAPSIGVGLFFAVFAVPAARIAAGHSPYESGRGFGPEAPMLTGLFFSLGMAAIFPAWALFGAIHELVTVHPLLTAHPLPTPSLPISIAEGAAFAIFGIGYFSIIAFVIAAMVSMPVGIVGWCLFNGLIRLVTLIGRQKCRQSVA